MTVTATPYRPPQRRIATSILTTGGWIMGSLHIPATARLLDYLNSTRGFLALTDASSKGLFNSLPFFALQTSSVLLLIPPTVEQDLQARRTAANQVSLNIWCLLETGAIKGEIDIIKGVRVSDFLNNTRGFVVLNDAHVVVRDPRTGESLEMDAPAILVHAGRITGVSETPQEG